MSDIFANMSDIFAKMSDIFRKISDISGDFPVEIAIDPRYFFRKARSRSSPRPISARPAHGKT